MQQYKAIFMICSYSEAIEMDLFEIKVGVYELWLTEAGFWSG